MAGLIEANRGVCLCVQILITHAIALIPRSCGITKNKREPVDFMFLKKGVYKMKKCRLGIVVLFALLLTIPASAKSPSALSSGHPSVDDETLSWLIAMIESHWSKDRYDQIPDEYRQWHSFGFYTSMGCDDISCTDLSHTHWCPFGVCQDKTHGHSEAEYREAARLNPVCPCHGDRSIQRY